MATTRLGTHAPIVWPAATHLPGLSSPTPDTPASLSRDASLILFGSARAGGEGQADIDVAARRRR